MDEKKLLDFINQHYEWTYPYVSGDEAKFERVKPCKKTIEYKTLEPNPQLGPRIIKLLPDACLKPCEWCQMIVNQKTNHTLKFMSIDGKRPKRRWEHSCATCKRTWDANTGKLKERVKPKGKELQDKKPQSKKTYWWNDLGDNTKG